MGRDFDEIEKTVMGPLDPGPNGEKVAELLEELQRLAGLGITQVHGSPGGPTTIEALRILGERVIPEAAKF